MHARQLAALARITNEQRLVDRGGALAGLPAQAALPRAADCVLFRVQRLPTYMGRALTG